MPKKDDEVEVEFIAEGEEEVMIDELTYEEAIIAIEDHLLSLGVPEALVGRKAKELYNQYYVNPPTLH